MKEETFNCWLERNWDGANMFCPPMSDTQFRIFIEKYLLPDDFCVNISLSAAQINTEILEYILRKYSKSYRKELKQTIKENDKKFKEWNKK